MSSRDLQILALLVALTAVVVIAYLRQHGPISLVAFVATAAGTIIGLIGGRLAKQRAN